MNSFRAYKLSMFITLVEDSRPVLKDSEMKHFSGIFYKIARKLRTIQLL